MRKSLIYFIIGIILLGTVLSQPTMPQPVRVDIRVNGMNIIDNMYATVKNMNTGEILDRDKSYISNGILFFDMGDFKEGVVIHKTRVQGDTIKIEMCNIDPKCTITFVPDEFFPKEFNIAITGITQEVIKEIEKEGETVTETVEKIVEKPVIIETPGEEKINVIYQCSDGTEVTNKDDCPENILYFQVWQLALILLGTFGFGAGFLKLVDYYWKKGDSQSKARAVKMLGTAVKKAKDGVYSKKK